jgi:crotonobetainyl-CoA:carnitine CoA-transferase CaiB-like acyl-CoA transferase
MNDMQADQYRVEADIRRALANRTKSDDFDIHNQVEAVLNGIGASLNEFGGELSFYGKDPIIPSVLRFGAFSAIGLAAKAAQMASIWRMKTGQTQNIHVDVRKALRRFATFHEGTLELMNGLPGNMGSEGDTGVSANFHLCKDGRWVFFTCNYPKLRNAALNLLQCPARNPWRRRSRCGTPRNSKRQAARSAFRCTCCARRRSFSNWTCFRRS